MPFKVAHYLVQKKPPKIQKTLFQIQVSYKVWLLKMELAFPFKLVDRFINIHGTNTLSWAIEVHGKVVWKHSKFMIFTNKNGKSHT